MDDIKTGALKNYQESRGTFCTLRQANLTFQGSNSKYVQHDCSKTIDRSCNLSSGSVTEANGRLVKLLSIWKKPLSSIYIIYNTILV